MSDSSNGVIKIHPGIWTDASTPVKMGHEAAQDVTNTLAVTINGLLEALGGAAFLSSAANLAKAVENFGESIERSLGCVAVDMAVVSSGLQVAAKAFASTDARLATLFQSLEKQLSTYTTTSAVPLTTPAKYTPYVPPKQTSSGGFSLGHAWHDITNWGHDAGSAVHNALSDVGVPSIGSQYAGDLVEGTVIGGIAVLGIAAVVAAG
ncbi:MAG TPA: hypothetical protein VGN34_02470 [Ktedonobacteraceae bacterium]|jgi:hypothetical protein